MKAWPIQLLAPWILFFLPWSAAAFQRRWAMAACLFLAWAGGLACATWLWFGPGVALFVLTGVLAVLTTRF
ncbi:hypothetical protein [Pseudorhodoferax sp. Leaf267]|uniref:hypothetical protein n=1 Tax=Pseudorhodoferax sp. Leaf267 TaxID=1736316 RepID=UPI0006FF8E16|nr:hypothetical protein [Pseudorhodoferax sp. Leaf267]KQP17920.1 hypothetical protein ASF43_08625 [Pseudorhodoferax sp. Leaf267]